MNSRIEGKHTVQYPGVRCEQLGSLELHLLQFIDMRVLANPCDCVGPSILCVALGVRCMQPVDGIGVC